MDGLSPTSSAKSPAGPARAVLFDMDGTLVDSEPYWIDVEYAMADKYGGTWSAEHAMQLVGNDLLESARYIREHMGIDRTPEQIVDELLDGVVERIEREVPWLPGAQEILADLHRAGVPVALVTMSWERFVKPVLAALPAGTFAAVVTGDQVSRGKPHPEPYLTAARLLDLEPADCVAVEDSNTGTRSAQAAGCRVVVVPNHVEVEALSGRTFIPTLAAVSATDLLQLG